METLMLKDIPVYDIASNIILDKKLCPFIKFTDTAKAYETWKANRYYLKTNRTAERIVKQAGGENTVEARRRLSLSDSYWIRYDNDAETAFNSITPYKVPFSSISMYKGMDKSNSVPELVLGGSQPKQWGKNQDGSIYMSKSEQGSQIHGEMLAVKLASLLGLKCMNAFVRTPKGKLHAKIYPNNYDYSNLGVINLLNITNPDRSMIQFDQLGISVNGYDPVQVATAFKQAGVEGDATKHALTCVLFDCVVGNVDRLNNTSNWAIFMDNTTGKKTPSWMYDFNWANLFTRDDEMFNSVTDYITQADLCKDAIDILNPVYRVCKEQGLDVWSNTAKELLLRFVIIEHRG